MFRWATAGCSRTLHVIQFCRATVSGTIVVAGRHNVGEGTETPTKASPQPLRTNVMYTASKDWSSDVNDAILSCAIQCLKA